MKILIADDHGLFREGLRSLLRELDPALEVLEAASAAEALQLAGRNSDLDLILLDLAMPGLDGFAGLDLLRERYPDIPVVVVSATESERDVRRALDAEAAGFIPKAMSGEDMLNAVHTVLDGEVFVPPMVGRSAGRDEADPHLTPRQQQVLNLMCEGRSNKEIAHALGMAEGTVKIHVTAILRAMKATNRTQAVIMAGQLGLAGTGA